MSNITFDMPIDRTVTVITDGRNITNIVFDMNIPDRPDPICEKAKEQFLAYFDVRATQPLATQIPRLPRKSSAGQQREVLSRCAVTAGTISRQIPDKNRIYKSRLAHRLCRAAFL